MRRAASVAVIGALGLAGCARTYRSVPSVVAEVRQDEVAAAVKMNDAEVGLRGRVKSKALRARQVVEGEVPFPAPLLPGSQAELRLKEENQGHVVLESAAAQPGSVICLFDSWAFEGLASVRQGETVELVCQFFKVEGEPPNRIPVFHQFWVP